jgi:hypothetical protein
VPEVRLLRRRESSGLLLEFRADLRRAAPHGVLGRIMQDPGEVIVFDAARAREQEMAGALLDVGHDVRELRVHAAPALRRGRSVDASREERVREHDAAVGADMDDAGLLSRREVAGLDGGERRLRERARPKQCVPGLGWELPQSCRDQAVQVVREGQLTPRRFDTTRLEGPHDLQGEEGISAARTFDPGEERPRQPSVESILDHAVECNKTERPEPERANALPDLEQCAEALGADAPCCEHGHGVPHQPAKRELEGA